MDERSGRYYRNGGIHWPAIIAQITGMVCAALLAERLLALRRAAGQPHRRPAGF